jgi:hypothetical protein
MTAMWLSRSRKVMRKCPVLGRKERGRSSPARGDGGRLWWRRDPIEDQMMVGQCWKLLKKERKELTWR